MKRSVFAILFLSLTLLIWSFTQSDKPAATDIPVNDDLEHFAMQTLLDSLKASDRPYLPFLTRSTLRCGIYRLEAGATDGQSPHREDEVYYVLSGKSRFKVGEEDVFIQSGDVLFVAANATHQFYDITEDLELLVFFSRKDPD